MQNPIYREKKISLKSTETRKKSEKLVSLVNVSGD